MTSIPKLLNVGGSSHAPKRLRQRVDNKNKDLAIQNMDHASPKHKAQNNKRMKFNGGMFNVLQETTIRATMSCVTTWGVFYF